MFTSNIRSKTTRTTWHGLRVLPSTTSWKWCRHPWGWRPEGSRPTTTRRDPPSGSTQPSAGDRSMSQRYSNFHNLKQFCNLAHSSNVEGTAGSWSEYIYLVKRTTRSSCTTGKLDKVILVINFTLIWRIQNWNRMTKVLKSLTLESVTRLFMGSAC